MFNDVKQTAVLVGGEENFSAFYYARTHLDSNVTLHVLPKDKNIKCSYVHKLLPIF